MMILINMMMAIINMAFEDIKSQADAYKSKFDILAYIKMTSRQLSGLELQKRDLPKYQGEDDDEAKDDDDQYVEEKKARAGEGFDSLFVGGGVTPTLSALHRQQDQSGGQEMTEEEVANLDLELELELDNVNAE